MQWKCENKGIRNRKKFKNLGCLSRLASGVCEPVEGSGQDEGYQAEDHDGYYLIGL